MYAFLLIKIKKKWNKLSFILLHMEWKEILHKKGVFKLIILFKMFLKLKTFIRFDESRETLSGRVYYLKQQQQR